MPLTDAGKHVMLNAFAGSAAYVSLHTGDPGTTGANEASGGSPAYARKAITWNAAAGGALDGNSVTFDVPPGTYPYVGYWTDPTAGTFLGSDDVTPETFAAQGQYVLDDADLSI